MPAKQYFCLLWLHGAWLRPFIAPYHHNKQKSCCLWQHCKILIVRAIWVANGRGSQRLWLGGPATDSGFPELALRRRLIHSEETKGLDTKVRCPWYSGILLRDLDTRIWLGTASIGFRSDDTWETFFSDDCDGLSSQSSPKKCCLWSLLRLAPGFRRLTMHGRSFSVMIVMTVVIAVITENGASEVCFSLRCWSSSAVAWWCFCCNFCSRVAGRPHVGR